MTDQRIIRPYPGFIIPTPRFIDVGMPTPKVGMSGRYQLIVRDAWGIEKRRTDWFDNIILDSGLNRMGTGAPIAGAAIGTGTSAPLATQTSLEALAYWTTSSQGGSNATAGSSPYNNTYTITYRTALGALDGNYTEVGVGWGSAQMFSRALILNGVGAPTSIAVGSAEQLDIVYQVSVYPPLVDTSNVVTISGVDYTVTGRAASVNTTSSNVAWTPSAMVSTVSISSAWASNGNIGVITASPGGSWQPADSAANIGSYSNNSLTRSGRISFGLTSGNPAGGIKSAVMGWNGNSTGCAFQYEFNPVIPKNNTKTLSLDFSMSWARRP